MGLVTPDFGLLFWMVITFLIVLYILKKFAWKPILDSLKTREDSISEALEAAEKAKDEMAKLKSDNEKILQEARAERESLLKDAREVKDKIIADAKKEASIEANKIITSARSQIQSEKTMALNEIKEQVVTLSVNIAEKILEKKFRYEREQVRYASTLLKDVELN